MARISTLEVKTLGNHSRKTVMKLCYRGVAYHSTPNQFAGSASLTIGRYRGVVCIWSTPHTPVAQSMRLLQYRGVLYAIVS